MRSAAPELFATLPIGRFEDGWSFMFRGYRIERGMRTFQDENGLVIWLTHARELRLHSWEDWKAALGRGGSIVGGSMKEITLPDFRELVEVRAAPEARNGSSGPTVRSRYDEMIAAAPDEAARERIRDTCWKDDAGYSFSWGWFSCRDHFFDVGDGQAGAWQRGQVH